MHAQTISQRPSREGARFYHELVERYPSREAFGEEELCAGASKWSDSPEKCDPVVVLSMRWSVDDPPSEDEATR